MTVSPTKVARGTWTGPWHAWEAQYRKSGPTAVPSAVAVGETVILLHPPLSLVGVLIGIKRGCHQNESLADG